MTFPPWEDFVLKTSDFISLCKQKQEVLSEYNDILDSSIRASFWVFPDPLSEMISYIYDESPASSEGKIEHVINNLVHIRGNDEEKTQRKVHYDKYTRLLSNILNTTQDTSRRNSILYGNMYKILDARDNGTADDLIGQLDSRTNVAESKQS